MAKVGAGHRVSDRIAKVLFPARLHTLQEILHMESRRIARATLRPFFHDQLARIAFVRLETLVAHCGPTVTTVEEVADTDVQWTAGRAHLCRRRSSRRRCRCSGALRTPLSA